MVSWIMLSKLKEAGRTLDDLAEDEWVLCEREGDWVEWVSRDTVVKLPWRVRSIEPTSPIEMAESFNGLIKASNEAWNNEPGAKYVALDDSDLATITPR